MFRRRVSGAMLWRFETTTATNSHGRDGMPNLIQTFLRVLEGLHEDVMDTSSLWTSLSVACVKARTDNPNTRKRAEACAKNSAEVFGQNYPHHATFVSLIFPSCPRLCANEFGGAKMHTHSNSWNDRESVSQVPRKTNNMQGVLAWAPKDSV